MSLLLIADKIPPCICRYLARKNHGFKPMSVLDIAAKSGLGKSTVAKLALRTSWKGIPIDQVEAFSRACGVNLLQPYKVFKYLRRAKRAHLDHATPQQREFFMRLFKLRG